MPAKPKRSKEEIAAERARKEEEARLAEEGALLLAQLAPAPHTTPASLPHHATVLLHTQSGCARRKQRARRRSSASACGCSWWQSMKRRATHGWQHSGAHVHGAACLPVRAPRTARNSSWPLPVLLLQP